MSAKRQILAAIFDMDGLLIDSEPLWDRAELEVLDSLGVDISRRDELPDLLLRIDRWSICGLRNSLARPGPRRGNRQHYPPRHSTGRGVAAVAARRA